MKKIIFFAAVFFASTSILFAQERVQDMTVTDAGPAISFEKTEHDFGDITQGDQVETVFTYTNNGAQPLVLSDVRTTCGCTAPDWSREPLLPGASADLTIRFNSAGKMGKQIKTITVISNAEAAPTSYVKIFTNVKPKDSE